MAVTPYTSTYDGAGLGNAATGLIKIPTIDGTITRVYLDFPDVADGDALFNLTIDGVSVLASSSLTIADTTEAIDVTGLSIVTTKGGMLYLNLESPLPAGLPDPPYGLTVYWDDGVAVVASSGGGGGMGEDGADGESWMIPGPVGPQGATGSAGSAGATGPQGPIGLPGGDGEPGETIMIPGVQGPAGATGATGATGPSGQAGFMVGEQGEPGESWMIPGPKGDTGATGAGGGGGGITWTEVTGTTQSASVNNGYIANNASLVTVTLPSTAAVGDIVAVVGSGAGGWKIAQNASQEIKTTSGGVDGVNETTAGTGGSLASTDRYDCVTVQCIGTNNTWVIQQIKGTLTIV